MQRATWRNWVVATVLAAAAGSSWSLSAADKLTKSKYAWTKADALAALARNNDDPYLQFVAIQTSRALGDETDIQSILNRVNAGNRFDRREDVDLFSLTSGALAVQESLQLDTLNPASLVEAPADRTVPVGDLKGPSVESHPWKKMLDGKHSEVSNLSESVPADFYFIESRSLNTLIDTLSSGDLWQRHIVVQSGMPATAVPVQERTQKQLGLEIKEWMRLGYDEVVNRVAVTGSDLYINEGSDITILFSLKQPAAFHTAADAMLAAAKASPGATTSNEKYREADVQHIETPDGVVDVFSADPQPDLHIRSNSKAAIRRVLDVILGGSPDAVSLGSTEEFRYIRTLMPLDAPEEGLFVYLSDPFIRRILGPQVKLAERRRLVGLSQLRTLGYAAALFETNYGRPAKSVEELVSAKCAPAGFTSGEIIPPFGGKFSLDPDGVTARCGVLGTAASPTPILELPIDKVSQPEADQYRQFLDRYETYWRTYFDPIAVRIQVTPERYRAETIVLPLINSSIYQGLVEATGGPVADLESLPVPPSNIGSLSVHLDKTKLDDDTRKTIRMTTAMAAGDGPQPPNVERLLIEGLGDTVSFNVCDSDPLLDMNLTQFGAMAMRWGGADDMVSIGMLVTSLTSPVYLAIPVHNESVVDQFLAELDRYAVAALREQRGRLWEFNGDYSLIDHPQDGRSATRVVSLSLGPITWRFYLARIGKGLYLASRRAIIDELAAAQGQPAEEPLTKSTPAHAMLRFRPEHWRKILPTYQLGWVSSARQRTLDNAALISPFLRTYLATHADSGRDEELVQGVQKIAEQVHGVQFLLPDGGEFQLSADRTSIVHSRFGDGLVPHQPDKPSPDGDLQKALSEFKGLSAQLTFLEDGLHAVVTIDRKAAK
jgi:hypothetical protein